MQYLLNAEQMKSADSHTIQDLGVSSRTLMERAAAACTDYIEEQKWPLTHVCIVCGSGNNGGDGFAIGSILKRERLPSDGSMCRTDDKPNRRVYISDGSVRTAWRNSSHRMAG